MAHVPKMLRLKPATRRAPGPLKDKQPCDVIKEENFFFCGEFVSMRHKVVGKVALLFFLLSLLFMLGMAAERRRMVRQVGNECCVRTGPDRSRGWFG